MLKHLQEKALKYYLENFSSSTILWNGYVTNLRCNKLKMKIVQNLFIHRFINFTHECHALKTHLTHKQMCSQMRYKLMNEQMSYEFHIFL